MIRADLHNETKSRLLAGEPIAPDSLTRYGVRAAAVISAIRRADLIPVARVPAPPVVITDPLTGKVTRQPQRKTAFYRVLPTELQRHDTDRIGQIADMHEQHQNRQKRDTARATIDQLTRAGLTDQIPETLHQWAALRVPAAGIGSSTPLITALQDVK